MRGSTLQARFTDNERNCFLKVLKAYPIDKVNIFINHAEFYCQEVLTILGSPKREHLLADTKPVLNSLHKTLEYLLSINSGSLAFGYHSTLNDRESGRAKDVCNSIVNTGEKANEIIRPLKEIIEQIEKSPSLQPGRRGHSSKDDLKKSLAVKLAESYNQKLALPTTYQFGEFFQILQLCLKSVELPHEFPDRLVKFAIESISHH
jgi:hypothetical protein